MRLNAFLVTPSVKLRQPCYAATEGRVGRLCSASSASSWKESDEVGTCRSGQPPGGQAMPAMAALSCPEPPRCWPWAPAGRPAGPVAAGPVAAGPVAAGRARPSRRQP